MNKAMEWRNKHPRCRYCKYYDVWLPPTHGSVISCKAKDKYLREPIFLDNRGMFCKLFIPKEVDED